MPSTDAITVTVEVRGYRAFQAGLRALAFFARWRVLSARLAYWIASVLLVRLIRVGVIYRGKMRWERVSPW